MLAHLVDCFVLRLDDVPPHAWKCAPVGAVVGERGARAGRDVRAGHATATAAQRAGSRVPTEFRLQTYAALAGANAIDQVESADPLQNLFRCRTSVKGGRPSPPPWPRTRGRPRR